MVLNNQKEDAQISKEITLPTFIPGSTLPYLGKNYKLKIAPDKVEDRTKTI
ncbi:MAG TPA: hypothetical protein VFV86_00170 [Nitrososphaeraceae archaeon]|nr:hypothetical protein [Nitrososphaeraceae archaeon]